MNGAEWVSAIGLGAILTKLLDAVWLSREIEKREARKWLYDRRLDAFALLAQDLLSFGIHDGGADNPFQGYANAAKALLLIDDDALVKRIDRFIVECDALKENSPADESRLDSLYVRLVDEARDLVRELRRMVLPKV